MRTRNGSKRTPLELNWDGTEEKIVNGGAGRDC